MVSNLDMHPDTLQRRALKDEVFEILHNKILAGKYQPGDWLRQEEIASQLGVSQTPVREALDLLVSVGLAERMLYRGVRVVQLSLEESADAYAMRLMLESAAARAAAENRTEKQLAELKSLLEQGKGKLSLDDISLQRQLNRQFHMTIVEASGNPLLCKLYTMVANTFPDWMLYEYMFRRPELLETSLTGEYEEHIEMVAAIEAGDADRAEAETLKHIRNLGDELTEFLGVPRELLQEKVRQLGIKLSF